MISGDGTNIGKKLHVINITFNMLNEGGNAMSADRNHLIAVIRDSEKLWETGTVPGRYMERCEFS